MAWGCNHWFQQGVYLSKDFAEYYKSEELRSQPQEGDADVAYRELAQINSQAEVGNDQILMFQSLLQKWQEQLNTNWSVNFEYIRLQQLRKCKYERKSMMEDPCIIMPLLNSQIVEIKANSRFTLYISADGSAFMMGRDFRPRSLNLEPDHDLVYGIPKRLNIPSRVRSMAMGQNHVLILSSSGQVYGMGSNHYGQLGIPNAQVTSYYEHPLTMHRMHYASHPTLIPFFNSGAIAQSQGNPRADGSGKHLHQDRRHGSGQGQAAPEKIEPSPVVQVACGDDFSAALTQSGKLYTWGLASDGRLGVRKATGLKVTDKSSHTSVPQQLQFTTDSIDAVHACGPLAYCEVTGMVPDGEPGAGTVSTSIYIWGSIPRGLNMRMNSQINAVPQEFQELKPYNFSQVYINHDFALGISHAVRLTFELPNEAGEYGGDKEGTAEFSVLAIPTLDGQQTASVDSLTEIISQIKGAPVSVINDFDVPWVT